jgi:hypothetical protein
MLQVIGASLASPSCGEAVSALQEAWAGPFTGYITRIPSWLGELGLRIKLGR